MQLDEKKTRRNRDDDILPPEDFAIMQNVLTDPQGMYTGVPVNPFEKPVQDADDL